MDAEKKYPLLFWLHGAGNPIESEETMTGFAQIAAREGFMIAMPQDTTPKKIEAILELVTSAAGTYLLPLLHQRKMEKAEAADGVNERSEIRIFPVV